jgi:hypothetical protein
MRYRCKSIKIIKNWKGIVWIFKWAKCQRRIISQKAYLCIIAFNIIKCKKLLTFDIKIIGWKNNRSI